MAKTLEDLLNPSFQVAQAKYENARVAVAHGYAVAGEVYAHLVDNSNVASFIELSRRIASEYEADLNKTLNLLEEAHAPQTPQDSRPS